MPILFLYSFDSFSQSLSVKGEKGHIYIEEKPAHYEITDGLPQYEGYPEGGTRQT